MTKGPSPLLGYNTNVRHKGRVFHIQTEDSGVQHPHVITHLFADGGRILKSIKTSYAELVGVADMAAQVKKIMQDQHKAMFIALRDGQFDHLFDAAGGDSKETSAPAVSGDLLSSTQMAASEGAKKPSAPVIASPKPSIPALTSPPAGSSTAPAAAASAEAPKRSSSVSMPAVRPPMPPGMTAPESATRPPTPLPAARPSTAPPSAAVTRPPPSQRAPARPSGASGHYQAIRSPEILGSFKKHGDAAAPASIFGDGLMSEKSLDEVILAYLAEDLDEPKR